MLDSSINEESIKDRVKDLFDHLANKPPTDRLSKAFDDDIYRTGGKLLDR